MDDLIWFCAGCGSTDVQVSVWADPNANFEVVDRDGVLEHGVCDHCGGDASIECEDPREGEGKIQRLAEAEELRLFVQSSASSIVHVWYSLDDGPAPVLAYMAAGTKAPNTGRFYSWAAPSFAGRDLEWQRRQCRVAIDKARRASSCQHKECVQHYIDTMRYECIREGKPLQPEDLGSIDRFSDELHAVATYNIDKANQAGTKPALVDVLREAFASYLGCVVEDKGWLEETYGGFEHNLRGALGAVRKRGQ